MGEVINSGQPVMSQNQRKENKQKVLCRVCKKEFTSLSRHWKHWKSKSNCKDLYPEHYNKQELAKIVLSYEEYQKQYRDYNPEYQKEYQKQYRDDNPEYQKEYQKKLKEDNPGYRKEYQKQYYIIKKPEKQLYDALKR